MDSAVIFTIPGEPKAWQRAGVRVIGKFAQHYTQAPTRSYESLVKMAASNVMFDRDPFDEPLFCGILIRKTPPSSVSKAKRAAMLSGAIRPGVKPDASNIAKGIEDALNGIVYRDDSLICDLRVSKVYAELAGVDVVIRPVAAMPIVQMAAAA